MTANRRRHVDALPPAPLGNCDCRCHQWPAIEHPDGPCCAASPYPYHGGRKATAAHPMCACVVVKKLGGIKVDRSACPMHGNPS